MWSIVGVVLEGDLELGPVGDHLAILNLQVELGDLSDAQVLQGLSRGGDGGCGRLLPGLIAGADKLNHLVYAFCHWILRWSGEHRIQIVEKWFHGGTGFDDVGGETRRQDLLIGQVVDGDDLLEAKQVDLGVIPVITLGRGF